MLTIFLTSLLLATTPAVSDAKAASPDVASAPAVSAYISFKQADYGPNWGHYRSLLTGMREYCGDQSSLCQVYCPHEGLGAGGKACRVVYACGDHITKSTEARSGEMIVMDCRMVVSGKTN